MPNLLLGEWNGTCIFSDADQESLAEVTNTVERDNGYLLKAPWISTLGKMIPFQVR